MRGDSFGNYVHYHYSNYLVSGLSTHGTGKRKDSVTDIYSLYRLEKKKILKKINTNAHK